MRGFAETGLKPTQYTRKIQSFQRSLLVAYLPNDRGGEPLTPGDIAEIIVFGATRRENVVFADSLVFPSHQVCPSFSDTVCGLLVFGRGQRLDIITARQHGASV